MNAEACRAEYRELLREREAEPAHVTHVARLALQLFDELQSLHGLGAEDRLLLEAAAHLHDIGWSVAPDGKRHHKESARLIREHAWKSLTEPQVNRVALVARYHRKARPKLEHEEFAALNETDRFRVRQLAALLRLADAFDRSHLARVKSLKVRIKPDRLVFHLTAAEPVNQEKVAAEKKGDLAVEVWGRSLLFTSPAAAAPRSAPR
jgi:exopolyphosphatase/guanosine-5'-triphosphate,3'-diphosphate pyrophosphatase